jgi:hypothetical protein
MSWELIIAYKQIRQFIITRNGNVDYRKEFSFYISFDFDKIWAIDSGQNYDHLLFHVVSFVVQLTCLLLLIFVCTVYRSRNNTHN